MRILASTLPDSEVIEAKVPSSITGSEKDNLTSVGSTVRV